MSSKRYFVDKTDADTKSTSQVGGGSKTVDKALGLRQQMKDQQERGSSASFSIREGRNR